MNWNLPNQLTVSRFIFTIIFTLLFVQEGFWSTILATAMFVLATLTDFLDGHLARKRKIETGFGKIMDPIADKFLMLSAFYLFAKFDLIEDWMFWVIAFREALVTTIRLVAVKKGRVLAAESMGKAKTIIQSAAVFTILLYIECLEALPASTDLFVGWEKINTIVMYVVVALTVVSGITFLKNNSRAGQTH